MIPLPEIQHETLEASLAALPRPPGRTRADGALGALAGDFAAQGRVDIPGVGAISAIHEFNAVARWLEGNASSRCVRVVGTPGCLPYRPVEVARKDCRHLCLPGSGLDLEVLRHEPAAVSLDVALLLQGPCAVAPAEVDRLSSSVKHRLRSVCDRADAKPNLDTVIAALILPRRDATGLERVWGGLDQDCLEALALKQHSLLQLLRRVWPDRRDERCLHNPELVTLALWMDTGAVRRLQEMKPATDWSRRVTGLLLWYLLDINREDPALQAAIVSRLSFDAEQKTLGLKDAPYDGLLKRQPPGFYYPSEPSYNLAVKVANLVRSARPCRMTGSEWHRLHEESPRDIVDAQAASLAPHFPSFGSASLAARWEPTGLFRPVWKRAHDAPCRLDELSERERWLLCLGALTDHKYTFLAPHGPWEYGKPVGRLLTSFMNDLGMAPGDLLLDVDFDRDWFSQLEPFRPAVPFIHRLNATSIRRSAWGVPPIDLYVWRFARAPVRFASWIVTYHAWSYEIRQEGKQVDLAPAFPRHQLEAVLRALDPANLPSTP